MSETDYAGRVLRTLKFHDFLSLLSDLGIVAPRGSSPTSYQISSDKVTQYPLGCLKCHLSRQAFEIFRNVHGHEVVEYVLFEVNEALLQAANDHLDLDFDAFINAMGAHNLFYEGKQPFQLFTISSEMIKNELKIPSTLRGIEQVQEGLNEKWLSSSMMIQQKMELFICSSHICQGNQQSKRSFQNDCLNRSVSMMTLEEISSEILFNRSWSKIIRMKIRKTAMQFASFQEAHAKQLTMDKRYWWATNVYRYAETLYSGNVGNQEAQFEAIPTKMLQVHRNYISNQYQIAMTALRNATDSANSSVLEKTEIALKIFSELGDHMVVTSISSLG
eukprot:749977-Hanusia_phi.AAC.6